jgi:hypothetical protein
MAVLSALVFHVEDQKDCLRALISGDVKIVFLVRGPLYFVMVSRKHEPIRQMMTQLAYIHSLITSLLTSGFNNIYKKSPNYDLRNLLGGTSLKLRLLVLLLSFSVFFLFFLFFLFIRFFVPSFLPLYPLSFLSASSRN